MKNQVVEVNYTGMLYTGIMYTGLVICGWLLIRLTIACFKLPFILREGQNLPDLSKIDDDEIKRIVMNSINKQRLKMAAGIDIFIYK